MAGISLAARQEKAALRHHGLQECTSCLDILPLDGFHRNKTATSGRSTRCKRCHNGHNGASKYDISVEEYLSIVEGDCQICGSPAEALDHCHTTGKIRGGLCQGCNRGIGLLGDDPDRLESAAAYLRRTDV